MGLSIRGETPAVFFLVHKTAMGPARGTTLPRFCAALVPELSWHHLSHRVRFALGANRRINWAQRHCSRGGHNGRIETSGGGCAHWRQPLLPSANAVLDQFERCFPKRPMRGGSRFGSVRDNWHCAGAVPVFAVGDLSFALLGQRAVPQLSMGWAAVGNRISRDLFRSLAMAAETSDARTTALAAGAVAPALAVVQTDVLLGMRETDERRSDVAQLDGAELSFRNTTVADVDWLVRAPFSHVGAQERHGRHVRD